MYWPYVSLCITCDEIPCGDGVCTRSQYCHQTCGPDGGLLHVCEPAPQDCYDCDCLRLPDTQRCEMVDGRRLVRDVGACG